mmetsp:Transcript_115606/g.288909  ORF Transcript_115606/g.288909 Transcript_115606/m.288909 type:complete len:226 (+) Transcript_115606:486-1163(+)
MSQAISRPGCATTGDISPRSSVRSTKRKAGLLTGFNNSVAQWSVSCRQWVTDSSSSCGNVTVMLETWHLAMYSDLKLRQLAMSRLNCSSGIVTTPVRLKLVRLPAWIPGSPSKRLSTTCNPCRRGLDAKKDLTIWSVQLRKHNMCKFVSGKEFQSVACRPAPSSSGITLSLRTRNRSSKHRTSSALTLNSKTKLHRVPGGSSRSSRSARNFGTLRSKHSKYLRRG